MTTTISMDTVRQEKLSNIHIKIIIYMTTTISMDTVCQTDELTLVFLLEETIYDDCCTIIRCGESLFTRRVIIALPVCILAGNATRPHTRANVICRQPFSLPVDCHA